MNRTTTLLDATKRHFARSGDETTAAGSEYYSFSARYDGCWFTILIGDTQKSVENRIPLVTAALPGATLRFGKMIRDEHDDTVWYEYVIDGPWSADYYATPEDACV